jgi:hypothetical protein
MLSGAVIELRAALGSAEAAPLCGRHGPGCPGTSKACGPAEAAPLDTLQAAAERVRDLYASPGNGYEGQDDTDPSEDEVIAAILGSPDTETDGHALNPDHIETDIVMQRPDTETAGEA